MLFKRKPPTPMEELLGRLAVINDELLEFRRNKKYMPTENDFKLLNQFSEVFHQGYALSHYVERKLRLRFQGLPEDAPKKEWGE